MSDTIAAIATGSQISAIGIVRISGDTALAVVDAVFRPRSGRTMSSYPDRQLVFGSLLDREGQVIDLCLCTISRGPNSYTGEDTAELQCHGSPVVLRQALESLFAVGARQALAGEFTRRAFLNGRMDLTGAEAVIDLIDAETAEAARNAAGQLGGAILRQTDAIYDGIVRIISHYHAVLDYPDEDIEPFELAAYSAALEDAQTRLRRLLDSFSHGRILREGVPAAIVGRPNAGKSSLLNALLGYERAIVTDVPGTTRDTIEEKVNLGGVLLRLTDTAGVRETGDAVERLGVARSRAAMQQAGLILVLCDSSAPFTAEDASLLDEAVALAPTLLVRTKCDLPAMPMPALCTKPLPRIVVTSAATGQGLDALADAVRDLFPEPSAPAGEILTNARHADAVARALEHVSAARRAMEEGVTPDAVLTEAEGALHALGELTGRTVTEDVTNQIFARFCVGK